MLPLAVAVVLEKDAAERFGGVEAVEDGVEDARGGVDLVDRRLEARGGRPGG